MANVDTPFGVWPVKSLSGHPWNGQAMRCWHSSTDTTAIYLGDPVTWLGNACTNGCCMEIVRATVGDGNLWLGPVVGVDPAVATSLIYVAASTERYVNVVMDPDMIYEIQADATPTKADVAANAVFIATHAGSTVTGISGIEMNSTTAQNASYQLLILGTVNREDNDIASANSKWLVLNNLHTLKAVDASGGGAAEGTLGL